MSVIGFGADELASAAIALVGLPLNHRSRPIVARYERACEALAAYSAANMNAFLATYHRETAFPETARTLYQTVAYRHSQAREIAPTLALADAAVMVRAKREAAGFAGLALYNLVANNGRDFTTPEIHATIARLSEALA
jgi:hypothetical protein